MSLRTLWTNFKDMETLFAATGELVKERQDSMYRPISPELPLTERVEEFCRQRTEVLEMLAPSARASQLREPFSAQLRKNRAGNIARVRVQLEEVFAPEITMAGASPNTGWLADCIALDNHGFVLTDSELGDDLLREHQWPLARKPYLFETSHPHVFAVGDVRANNVKRVASAVGEGSVCIQLVHRALAE